MSDETHSEFVEVVARKLRRVVGEYGESIIHGCSIVSCIENLPMVCGFHHYYGPTLAAPILVIRQMPELESNLTFKAARLFEEA